MPDASAENTRPFLKKMQLSNPVTFGSKQAA